MMKRFLFVLTVLIFLISCLSQPEENPGVPEVSPDWDLQKVLDQREEVVFTIAQRPARLNLDPARAYTSAEAQYYTAVYEGLCLFNPLTLEVLPGAAQRWEESEDKTTYTFYLRQGSYFNNGDPLRAEDFRNAWFRMIDPELKAEYSGYFDIIKGAAAYRRGEDKNKEHVGIKTRGTNVLIVELEHPASHFLKLLCHMSFVPVHPSYLNSRNWGEDQTVISNGPYTIFKKSKNEIFFVKNELYWNAQMITLEMIDLYQSDDLAAITRGFQKGQIHWAQDWDFSLLTDEEKDDYFIPSPILGASYLFFRTNTKPWNDQRVRRGLCLLLPWTEIREPFLDILPDSLIPPFPGYNKQTGLTQDVEAGLALLKEAGFEDLSSIPEIHFKVTPGLEDREVKVMKETWEKYGIKIKVTVMDFDSYIDEMKVDDYTIGNMTWIADYPDPLSMLEIWQTSSNLNDARYSNPSFDDLMRKAREEEGEERFRYMEEGEQMLLSSGVIMPTAYYFAYNLVNLRKIEGWIPNILDIHPMIFFSFREIELVPDTI